MNFSEALIHMRNGHKMQRSRRGLNNGYVRLAFAGESEPTQNVIPEGEYVFLERNHNSADTVPWSPTHADLLAEDWEIAR